MLKSSFCLTICLEKMDKFFFYPDFKGSRSQSFCGSEMQLPPPPDKGRTVGLFAASVIGCRLLLLLLHWLAAEAAVNSGVWWNTKMREDEICEEQTQQAFGDRRNFCQKNTRPEIADPALRQTVALWTWFVQRGFLPFGGGGVWQTTVWSSPVLCLSSCSSAFLSRRIPSVRPRDWRAFTKSSTAPPPSWRHKRRQEPTVRGCVKGNLRNLQRFLRNVILKEQSEPRWPHLWGSRTRSRLNSLTSPAWIFSKCSIRMDKLSSNEGASWTFGELQTPKLRSHPPWQRVFKRQFPMKGLRKQVLICVWAYMFKTLAFASELLARSKPYLISHDPFVCTLSC